MHLALLLLLAAACGDKSSTDGTGTPTPDGGSASDGGTTADGGATTDGGATGDAGTTADGGTTTDGGADGGAGDSGKVPAGDVIDSAAVYLDECKSMPDDCDGSSPAECGACYYRTWYRSDGCTTDAPCDDLLLYWAPGNCESAGVVSVFSALLDKWPDMVIACLQPAYPGENFPVSLGAPERENHLVDTVFTQLKPGGDVGVWSGRNLLMGGCSMGASRYPVVAARYPTDAAAWAGTDHTAACLSDGVVDVRFQDNYTGTEEGVSCEGRHVHIAETYTGVAGATEHSCTASPSGQCACDPAHASRSWPDDCGGGDCVDFDSIIDASTGILAKGVDLSLLPATDWKLVTEGGDFAGTATACDNDIVPREHFDALCTAIDDDADHRCQRESYAGASHCTYYPTHIADICVQWFRDEVVGRR